MGADKPKEKISKAVEIVKSPKLEKKPSSPILSKPQQQPESRAVSRPRNLPSKEAWVEAKDHNTAPSSHGASGARVSSVALANMPKQLVTTSKNNPHRFLDLNTDKPSTVRSKSQEKSARTLTQRKSVEKQREDHLTLNVKTPSTTNNSSGLKRTRSNASNLKSGATHSRNGGEKQSSKWSGTNGRTCTRPVDGLTSTRSSSRKEPIPRGKTTSQTPRPTQSQNRPSALIKNQPPTSVQKAINCFLSKGTPSTQNHSRDGSKLRNLKGVAIDLEAASHKLQKHAVAVAVPSTDRTAATGQTPGHGRRYKSDYLNNLMNSNNQNVSSGTGIQTKGKIELKTPPDLRSRISVPLSSGQRAESAIGGYNSATNGRATLAVKDNNKRPAAPVATGKVQQQTQQRATGFCSSSTKGHLRGQSRVPYV